MAAKSIILCTHHKGGVGKTELAIHISGILRKQPVGQTLLVDCDSQASSWEFYFGESPTIENEPLKVNEQFSVIWNPARVRLKSIGDLKETYDYFVIDIDSPLENTVQTIVQDDPDLVLVPVNLQPEALTRLKDPLGIIAKLDAKAGHCPRVRIVPLGAKVAAVRSALRQTGYSLKDCLVAPKIRNLEKQANQARKERRYIWTIAGCEDLEEYYEELLKDCEVIR